MFELILWDWNGTLLNDVGASLAAVNDMLARRGRLSIGLEAYRSAIDVPIRRFYETYFDMTCENYPALLCEYAEKYERQLAKFGLSEGVARLLKKLRSDGALQIILSSGEQSRVEKALEKYGVAGYFDAVLGAEDYLAGSKLERAKRYMKAQKIKPEKTLLVGDLVHDYEVARELGVSCVLVDWGHQGAAQFKGLDVKIISSLSELF